MKLIIYRRIGDLTGTIYSVEPLEKYITDVFDSKKIAEAVDSYNSSNAGEWKADIIEIFPSDQHYNIIEALIRLNRMREQMVKDATKQVMEHADAMAKHIEKLNQVINKRNKHYE